MIVINIYYLIFFFIYIVICFFFFFFFQAEDGIRDRTVTGVQTCAFRSSSNTFTSLPLIDAETLDFEVHVDGFVSTGGLGGPAILPLSLAKMSQLTQAFPNKRFSGIGGISTFEHALHYLL